MTETLTTQVAQTWSRYQHLKAKPYVAEFSEVQGTSFFKYLKWISGGLTLEIRDSVMTIHPSEIKSQTYLNVKPFINRVREGELHCLFEGLAGQYQDIVYHHGLALFGLQKEYCSHGCLSTSPRLDTKEFDALSLERKISLTDQFYEVGIKLLRLAKNPVLANVMMSRGELTTNIITDLLSYGQV